MAYLASALIADVRRRGMMPSSASSSAGYADSDVLAHANHEMSSFMVPLVMSLNEEFFCVSSDVATVSGQSAYRLPARNIGGKLRDVQLLYGAQLLSLARIEPEELSRYSTTAAGVPSAFWLDAGAINLIPTPSAGMTLRLRYFARPGALTVTAADFTQISSIASSSTSALTLNIPAASGAGLTSNNYADIISSQSPYEPLLLSGLIASNSGTQIALSSLTSAQLYNYSAISNFQTGGAGRGAYVAKEGESPIVQLPDELHSLFSWRTLCGMLRQMGSHERLQACEAEAERLERVALRLLAPRVDGEPKKMMGAFLNGYNGLWVAR